MPTWGELQYELPDARLVQAQREILRWYGKKVDIDTKAKSLLRFGWLRWFPNG